MSVISLSWFKESWVVYISFRFLVLCSDSTKKNEYEIFSQETLSRAGQRTARYWYKIFSLKHILRFSMQKTYISKLSTKMFLKRKTRPGKVCTYQMLLILVTFFKKTFHWTPVSVVKQLQPDIIQFFAGHCLISGPWYFHFSEFSCINCFPLTNQTVADTTQL